MHARETGSEPMEVMRVTSFNVILNAIFGESAMPSFVVDELKIGLVNDTAGMDWIVYITM